MECFGIRCWNTLICSHKHIKLPIHRILSKPYRDVELQLASLLCSVMQPDTSCCHVDLSVVWHVYFVCREGIFGKHGKRQNQKADKVKTSNRVLSGTFLLNRHWVVVFVILCSSLMGQDAKSLPHTFPSFWGSIFVIQAWNGYGLWEAIFILYTL